MTTATHLTKAAAIATLWGSLAACQTQSAEPTEAESVELTRAALTAQGTICADQAIPADYAIVGHIYGANDCAPAGSYDELTKFEYAKVPFTAASATQTETICGDNIPAGWIVSGWDNSGNGCNDPYVHGLPAFVIRNLGAQPAGTQLRQCTYTYLGDQAVPAGWSQVGATFYAEECRAGNDSNTSAPNARTIVKNAASCPTGTAALFLNHQFATLNGWLDISALNSFRDGNSLFQAGAVTGAPGGSAVKVKDALQGAYRDNYPQKGAAALDYKFPCPIDRTKGTVTLEWSMKVETRDNGEGNRFMVVLLTDMNKKADLASVDTYTEGPYTTTGHEYGVPTYHVRIISDQVNAAGGIRLAYGQHIEKTAANEYIPGFISPFSANGGNGSWNDPNKFKLLRKTTSTLATQWVTYKWVIERDWQYLYENGVLVKPSNSAQVDPPGSGKVWVGPAATMPAAIKPYYPDYKHFPTLAGVRLYMRNETSASGTWVSHLKVTQAQ